MAVIESLYDAATDESLWPRALKHMADFTASQAATFWVLDGSDKPRLPVFTSVNFDPVFINEYLEQMAQYDPWNRYLVAHSDEPVVHDGLVITEPEKDRHPYFDWHHGHSDTRFRLIGRVTPAPAAHAGVALHRTRRKGRYEADDVEQFWLVYKHLRRALTIGFRLNTLGALQQCTMELLDRHPAAILLLDAHRRIVFANRSAEELCAARDGLLRSEQGISAQCGHNDERLQRLISGALSRVVSPCSSAPGGVMSAERPSGKRAYLIVVSAIAGKFPALAVLRPAVCIMITDPAAEPAAPHSRFQTLFGLTAAEARLAALLAAGEDLRSAAAKLKITYGTARARLAVIFQKTDTRRQTELLRLLITATSTAPD